MRPILYPLLHYPPPGGVLPYKGLMGTCGQPGYVFRDFCLKQGNEFIIFCLNQCIDLSIFVLNRINVLNRVSKLKSEFCLKLGRKISDICLKQGQGMRGRAAPPHPGIYRVPPPPGSTHIAAHERLSTPSRSTSLAFSKRSDGGVRRRRYILCSLLNTLPTAVRVILCSKRIQTVKRL